jgi:hypothetical protein
MNRLVGGSKGENKAPKSKPSGTSSRNKRKADVSPAKKMEPLSKRSALGDLTNVSLNSFECVQF